MGNTICRTSEEEFDYERGANTTDLDEFVNTAPYLTKHSDLVALMVLEHQTQMHNAIIRANFETRLAIRQSVEMSQILDRPDDELSDSAKRRIESVADNVVDHLLMIDDFEFSSPVQGTTEFATQFSARGKRDSLGRSLRQIDGKNRLFRYPCSYLIHSESFASLPDEVRSLVLRKLVQRLQNESDPVHFAHLTPEVRSEILAILLETIPEIREYVSTTRE